jgi:mRNA-degrading endonuclease RelE of RelBE toxin-antitoxin system
MDMRQVLIHRRAERAIKSLSAQNRRIVERAIVKLGHFQTPAATIDHDAQKLPSIGSSTYSYKAGMYLRLVFEITQEGGILIQDVVSHEILRHYFNWRDGA